MTSEVVVMNRLAVALAADSAVTADGYSKVHNSANKLFMLSECHPVGVMVYNNSSLMTLPWETLIKEFRTELGTTEYDHLEQYGDAFIKFVESKAKEHLKGAQSDFFLDLVDGYFLSIYKEIKGRLDQLQSAFSDSDGDAVSQRGQIYREIIERHAQEWAALPPSPSVPAGAGSQIAGICSAEIASLTTKRFKIPNPQLGHVEVSTLRQLAIDLVEKDEIPLTTLTGVVIAGFGRKDYFPVLQVYEVGDTYGDSLKLKKLEPTHIGNDKSTHVETFADSDTANAFLNGMPTELERKLIEWVYLMQEQLVTFTLEKMRGVSTAKKAELQAELDEVGDALVLELVDKLEDYKNEHYVYQADDAIRNLPKDELAHVAAALVNINLLKKRMSRSLETVGGPIDVAVISKGDGFIWIDRKHYFSASKNPQFLRNRFGSTSNASNGDGQ